MLIAPQYFSLRHYVAYFRRRTREREARPRPLPHWLKSLLHKERGHAHYTIIAACYNVEKYLAEFFDSLIGQRLDFRNNVQLICVDDGSTDGTAAIIKAYQQRFPENITYLYKENGGQASARNMALQHVRTEWFSYVDPDDFLDYNCLYEVDRRLAQHPQAALAAMRIVYYLEKNLQFGTYHPLDYKYKSPYRVLPISDMGDCVQLSQSFFRTDIVRKHDLQTDERIKPTFEDAHFISRYLLHTQDKEILFLRRAKYYYRKRKDASSSVDGKYKRKCMYRDIVEYGYRDILRRYAEAGISHDYAKRLFLYDIMFQLRDYIAQPEILDILSEEEKKTYITLLRDCFSYISLEDLERININGVDWFWKLALAACFKQHVPEMYIAVPTDYDSPRQEVTLRLFGGAAETDIELIAHGVPVAAAAVSTSTHRLAGEVLLREHHLRLPLTEASPLRLTCNGKPVVFCRLQQGNDILINAKGTPLSHYFAPAPEHVLTLTLNIARQAAQDGFPG